jgi:transposase-like protein
MPAGRPTVYKPEYAEIARDACMTGASSETLAEHFGVCRRTIDSWIATVPEFGDAVRHARQVADGSVVAALYARATGLKRKTIKIVEGNGDPVTTTLTVDVLPDVRACIFWLRNRQPEQWREDRTADDDRDRLHGLAEAMEEGSERVRQWEEAERAKADAAGAEADAALRSQAERLQVVT